MWILPHNKPDIRPQEMSVFCWAPVAHTHHPSYSGGRDQEDHGLKPTPDK
jgi:hypothetical protein